MAAQLIAGFQNYQTDLDRCPVQRTGGFALGTDIAQAADVRIAPSPEPVRDVPPRPEKGQKEAAKAAIDQPTVEPPKRAQPLPKPPKDVIGDTIERIVPVEFFMR